MIKNERQYRISASAAERFESALAARRSSPPADSGIHPRMWQAEEEALRAQVDELRADIAAYDALRSGRQQIFAVSQLTDLPRALIEARIAAGLTQKDLAVRLDLPEQAIQRYESTDYSTASLERLQEVASAVGVELSGLMALRDEEPSPQRFFRRLKEIGLQREFVVDRLLPPRVAGLLSAPTKQKDLVFGALLQAAVAIERIFDISPRVLFSDSALHLDPIGVGIGRFKKINRQMSESSRTAFTSYTVFAHYLALVTLQATEALPRPKLPKGWRSWRASISNEFGAVSFENVVRFLWSVGIPVLPLRDAGRFHGACWRTAGRNIVVLKQRSSSQDRWLFDTLHEAGHIDQERDTDSFGVIENEIPSADDPKEKKATRFAAEIVLDGIADQLAKRAVEGAQGRIQFLEQAARQVAQEAQVPLGALANYLAFRIAEDTADGERINWWGTAARLQEDTEDPWRIARDIFLERVDLSTVNAFDRELLVRTLTEHAHSEARS
jgi:transcriptional regulator with XRE-family HTH domain/Zn-dependent peptidase ImmA (M78 family)